MDVTALAAAAAVTVAGACAMRATARRAPTAPGVAVLATLPAVVMGAMVTWLALSGEWTMTSLAVAAIGGAVTIASLVHLGGAVTAAPVPVDHGIGEEGLDGIVTAAAIVEREEKAMRAAASRIAKGRERFMARMRDLFTTTADEDALIAATASLAGANAHLSSRVAAYVLEETERLIDARPATRAAIDLQRERLRPMAEEQAEAERITALGETALASGERALSELSSAHTTEIMDLVSSNKGIALMSTMQNSTASDAVRQASEDAKAFAEAARSAVHCDVRMPEDMVDFVMDMAMEGFDFMSILSLGRISDATESCERMMESLRPAVAAMHRDVATATEAARPDRERLADLRRPFVEKARSRLPAEALRHLGDVS